MGGGGYFLRKLRGKLAVRAGAGGWGGERKGRIRLCTGVLIKGAGRGRYNI